MAHIQEFHINLNDIHHDISQRIQGRISASEIIHQQGKAGLLQIAHCVNDLISIIHIGTFRNFYLYILLFNLIFIHQAVQLTYYIDGEHIDPGNINRNRYGFDSCIFPSPDFPTHLFPDEHIQIGNKSILFQHGNEGSRTDHSLGRMTPAH